MEVKIKNYSFQVHPGQNKDHWMLISSTNWESQTFKIFDYYLHENSFLLDLGCWSGVLALYAAHKVKLVHAVDPDPVCFSEFKKNISLNPNLLNKIKAYNIAISNQNGFTNLSARLAYGLSSTSILRRKRDALNSFKVKTERLESFIKNNHIKTIDFIKMDVEGAEFKILPTVLPALEKLNFPTIYISFHYHYLNENLFYKNVPFKFLNKLLLKLEHLLDFNFFKQKLKKEILASLKPFISYKYIYGSNGIEISYSDLINNPEIIKELNLVFTNQKWDKN